jgi:hypothetical protein
MILIWTLDHSRFAGILEAIQRLLDQRPEQEEWRDLVLAISNYERDAPPRGVERESVLIHLGLSMFVTFEAAADRAMRWPALGTHIALVRLEPDHGFHVAETGARVHRPSGVVPCSCSLASPMSCL